MVLMALFTTFITTPIVVTIYKPARMAVSDYKLRTIQRDQPNTQHRLLICFNTTRNIPSLINLMEASRGTGNILRVYAMHLMELSERSSAILMAHKARRNGMPFWTRKRESDPNQVVIAFESFRHLSHVSVHPTTAISSMSTMHIDICNSAAKKKVAMIILPFHKHLRVDGRLETARAESRHVNRRVLEHAPCSVGVFIDRGLGGTSHVAASNVDYTVTTFLFGGHDDYEAVSYAALMAEHPGISLDVVRFVVGPAEGRDAAVRVDVDSGWSDEQVVFAEFVAKASRNGSIRVKEVSVRNVAETVDAMRMYDRCNLFVVGRTPEGELAAALNNNNGRNDCPELGPVGNLLISEEFSTLTSMLVVQKYRSQLTGESLNSLKIEDLADQESDSQ